MTRDADPSEYLRMTGITTSLIAAAASGFTFPPTFVKDAVNFAAKPQYFITLATLVFALMFVLYKWWTKPLVFGAIFTLFCIFYFGSTADENFRAIVAKPDNVPITMM